MLSFVVSFLEKAFADLVLHGGGTEEESLFLTYLFLASKSGHIAVEVGKNLFPPLDEESAHLQEKIIKGATLLRETPFVVRLGNRFYLQRHFALETKLIDLIKERVGKEVWPKLENELSLEGLLNEQAAALLKASKMSLMLLTGGPGTGKSYTASRLITSFWKALSDTNRDHFEVAIAAPTGKASSHLYESLTKGIDDPELLNHITSRTLHSLLGIKKENHDLFESDIKPISADLVIVDESSMIDLTLMVNLFASLKEGARLVLIGDPHQLPSIESGSIFADIVELLPSHVIELTRCVRSDIEAMVNLSLEIKAGTFELLKDGSFRLPFVENETPLEHQKQIVKFMCAKVEQNFRALAPLRKGPLGIEELNHLCLNHLKQKNYRKNEFSFPIIFTKTVAKEEIYNGDGGSLFFDLEGRPTFASVKERNIPIEALPPFELGLCLSIHKSQGSEFDEVLVIMPKGSESFGKEILYTATTRAKKRLQVFASDKTLISCLQKKSRRLSSLLLRFDN